MEAEAEGAENLGPLGIVRIGRYYLVYILSSQMINSNFFFVRKIVNPVVKPILYLLVESKMNCNWLSNHGGREQWVRREFVKAWVHWRKVANPRAT